METKFSKWFMRLARLIDPNLPADEIFRRIGTEAMAVFYLENKSPEEVAELLRNSP